MASSPTKKPYVIKPFPTLRKVAPYPFPTLQMPECEHDLFDSVYQENISITGTPVDYYVHEVADSVRDPLYDEAVKRAYRGPFRMSGFITWPDSAPEARLEGGRTTFSCEMWVSRKECEDMNIGSPNETDVIRVWKSPFFDAWAVDGVDGIPNAGYFFDVIDCEEDGHLFDALTFLGFKLTLKRRTEFTPERRITNT